MRVLALDHGTRRIGVAVSDETKTIAQPLEYILAEPFATLPARLSIFGAAVLPAIACRVWLPGIGGQFAAVFAFLAVYVGAWRLLGLDPAYGRQRADPHR